MPCVLPLAFFKLHILTDICELIVTIMAHRSTCLRALRFLSLIAWLQVSSTAALPFADTHQGTGETIERDHLPDPQPHLPQEGSINGIDYATTPTPSQLASEWQATAYQIGDGQVQAPYSGAGVWSSVTDGSTPSLATRGDGGPSTSTSYTTVYVQPSPTATSSTSTAQNMTPSQSLTSLTTSEMQTATAPAPKNTTGVSGLFHDDWLATPVRHWRRQLCIRHAFPDTHSEMLRRLQLYCFSWEDG